MTNPKAAPATQPDANIAALNRRIMMLDMALSEAARERFPEGSFSDAKKRIQAKKRWIHNAYREAREKDKYAE